MSEANAKLLLPTYGERQRLTVSGHRQTRTEPTTMEHVTIVIPGQPVPKARPRFTRTGRTYTDARTRQVEQVIRAAWLTQAGHLAPHDGPVHVRIQFVFPIPASWPKWRRALAAKGEGRIPHTSRPDLDNLVKTIKDGLNGHAWMDDAQVINLHARKDYGPEALTRVMFTFHHAPKGTTK